MRITNTVVWADNSRLITRFALQCNADGALDVADALSNFKRFHGLQTRFLSR